MIKKKNRIKTLFTVHCSLFTVLLFSLFPFTSSLHASPFELILSDDPVLQDIKFLSLESGKPFLSYSPPYGINEIENFIKDIDTEPLSDAALGAYNRITERLTPKALLSLHWEYFTAMANLNIELETSLKFNSDIVWPSAGPETKPLLSFPVRLHFANSAYFFIDPAIIRKINKEDRWDNFGINIPLSLNETENRSPLRAFGAFGSSWWNFQIGRDKLFWGSGNTGSLVFSDNSDYYTYARVSFFAPSVKYSIIVNQMPLALGSNVDGLDKGLVDWDKTVVDWDQKDSFLTNSVHRYFYLHRFDVSIMNRINLSVMEGVMAGNSPLELRFLNPVILFHSLFSWYDYPRWPVDVYDSNRTLTGSFLSFELNLKIINSLSAYGQFVMNQYATKDELKGRQGQPPNGLGYMAGIQYSQSIKKWSSIIFLEFIYTDPYLYILGSPFASFIHMDYSGQYRYIGYPRDTISISAGTGLFNGGSLSIKCKFSYLAKGEHDINGLVWDWTNTPESQNERTPSGKPENNFILSLDMKYNIMPYLTLNGNFTGIISHNNRQSNGKTKQGGQLSLGIQLSI